MHEYSITESLLSLALEKAKENQAARITRINVILGELSGVVGECVQQYFEILAKDTAARGAVLNFETKPTALKCRKCGKEFTPPGHQWDCPDCHEANVEIVSGRESYLESIEVE
jgi:hydrogenase nickel incorporation protein HypA/HybF